MDDTIAPLDPQSNLIPEFTWIYRLRDPETQEIRYVGKTNDPQKRLRAHIRDQSNTYKGHWLTSLRKRGLKPIMEIIEKVPFAIWAERELYWIEYYLQHGHPLTNTFLSGGGVSIIPPETRAKIGAANRGRKASPETRAKMSASQRGKKHKPMPEEARRRAADKHLGMKHSLEFKLRIAALHRGNTYTKGFKHSDETRAKMSAGHKGKPGHKHTPESKAKLSAARLDKPGHPSTPETNAKISAALTGRKKAPFSEEWRHNLGNATRGKKQSPEHVAKKAEAIRGRKHTPEAKAKISAAAKGRVSPLKGKPLSEETKAKLSRAKSGKKQSPETIAKRVAGRKKAKAMRENPPNTPTLWD